jgi:hypothetical protein
MGIPTTSLWVPGKATAEPWLRNATGAIIGLGEFYPNEKYVKNGWQPFVAEWKKTEWKEGKAKENEWWKWARC